MAEVERFIRIQNLVQAVGHEPEWRTLPNCLRVRVWHFAQAEALADELTEAADPRRYIFHVTFQDKVTRGCRVTYLGNLFTVLEVSDSPLRGTELRCAPI